MRRRARKPVLSAETRRCLRMCGALRAASRRRKRWERWLQSCSLKTGQAIVVDFVGGMRMRGRYSFLLSCSALLIRDAQIHSVDDEGRPLLYIGTVIGDVAVDFDLVKDIRLDEWGQPVAGEPLVVASAILEAVG